MVHYVSEGVAATTSPSGTESQAQMGPQPLDAGTEALIRTEIEILTGFDVARIVATNIGPERILAKKGGGNQPLWAASVISSGIEVAPPRSAVLKITFSHPDKDLVQPALTALIRAYMDEHLRIHLGGGVVDSTLIHQKSELSRKLAESEVALRDLQSKYNILFLDDTENSKNDIAEARKALSDAKNRLEERQASLGDLGGDAIKTGGTNSPGGSIPAQVLTEYGNIDTDLASIRNTERELRLLYTEAWPS